MVIVEPEPVVATHPAATRPARPTVIEIVFVLVAVSVIVWPYLQYPGQVLYNRYFEAPAIFDPTGAIRTFGTGWSNRFHLGYPTLTELSYLSVFTGFVWLAHALGGTMFASRAFPIAMALFTFASMYVFLRSSYRRLGLGGRLLCAGFFAVNPLTAGMVHEGYSGMQVDYALIPLELWLIDRAVSTRREALLAALPLLFILTAMFKLPEIAIDWAIAASLRWSVWVDLFRRMPILIVAFIASLAVNAYWAFPMLLNLKLHAFLPIQDDTASEIALSTQYSTLSNVVLARVFGSFENNAGLCHVCAYYSSSEFTLGMMLVIGIALFGLVHSRRWAMLSLLALSVAMSTGYHYQDDLIGLPYQLLMQLPTFNIFRSANVFLIATFFLYSTGIALALSEGSRRLNPARRNALHVAAAGGVVLASWPMLSGSILEKGVELGGVVSAPNFFVRVPPAYRKAADYIGRTDDGVTLLYPNQAFADYRWGAYVQDFLPWIIDRPTLAAWYWRQNNPDVQSLLAAVTQEPLSETREAQLLRALRVRQVFIHDDVVSSRVVDSGRFGKVVFSSGAVTIRHPAGGIVAFAEQDRDPVVSLDGTAEGSAMIAALTGRIVRSLPPGTDPPCEGSSIAESTFPERAAAFIPLLVSDAVRCDGRYELEAFVKLSHGMLPQFVRVDNSKLLGIPTSISRRGAISIVRASVRLKQHERLGLFPREAGDEVLTIVVNPNDRSDERPADAIELPLFGGIGNIVRLGPSSTSLVLHRSDDPSWIALVIPGFRAASKFSADGYAAGWRAPAGSRLLVLNLAQLAFVVGAIVSLASLSLVVAICLRASRRRPIHPAF